MEYYARQVAVPRIGAAGQARLNSSVLVVVGCGGLCSGVLPSIAGFGSSKIRLIDGDKVELSNLHRQSIHGGKIGQSKAESAKTFALNMNPGLNVEAISQHLTPANAVELLAGASLIFDCTDNLPTRRLISDASRQRGITPVISGSALQLSGQILRYNFGPSDSYRTLLGSQSTDCVSGQDCSSAGIFGPIPQFIGHLMAIEGAKYLLGWEAPAYNFITYDMQSGLKYLSLKTRANEIVAVWQPADYARGIAPSTNAMATKHWVEMEADPNKIAIDVRPESVRKSYPAPMTGIPLPLDSLADLCAASKTELAPQLAKLINLGAAQPPNVYLFCQRGVSCMKGAAMLRSTLDRIQGGRQINVYGVNEGVLLQGGYA